MRYLVSKPERSDGWTKVERRRWTQIIHRKCWKFTRPQILPRKFAVYLCAICVRIRSQAAVYHELGQDSGARKSVDQRLPARSSGHERAPVRPKCLENDHNSSSQSREDVLVWSSRASKFHSRFDQISDALQRTSKDSFDCYARPDHWNELCAQNQKFDHKSQNFSQFQRHSSLLNLQSVSPINWTICDWSHHAVSLWSNQNKLVDSREFPTPATSKLRPNFGR